MNQHSALGNGSLIERAAELYGFSFPTAAPAAPAPAEAPAPAAVPEPQAEPPVRAWVGQAEEPLELSAEQEVTDPWPVSDAAPAELRSLVRPKSVSGQVDREALRAAGFIDPDSPIGALAEEFRIVKRQLLLGAADEAVPPHKRRNILVCSAQPDEGKTFCTLNLALSLASERDVEVLLVDADFPKPEIMSILGLEAGPGLVDALADQTLDVERLVVRTDIEGLSVLPAGRQMADVTELLGSARTAKLIAALSRPGRIVLFDSPPVLMASPATVLAAFAGQLVMVVRADQTPEADLREAVGLLSACDRISLLLNGTGFAATGRRFGSYYGYGQ